MGTSHIHPIRVARKRQGLTLEEVGAQVGASKCAVSRWENFKDEPKPRTAIALTRLLPGLTFEQIYPEQGRAAA